jgi:lysophospholipid acyltransferase (LPLAT)-like uncharacterized protein
VSPLRVFWLLVAGVALGIVARVWLATLRVRVVVAPELEAFAERPWVLSFFHGTQWPLLAWKRRRRTVVMVSHSRDGVIQARALGWQGLEVVRGSSSRGGARGLASLVRRMKRESLDAAFAVDGPRGPYGVVKEGALLAARATGAVLVPMGSYARTSIVLARAWDRFTIALPFSRVTVTLGAPVLADDIDARVLLEAAIAEANYTSATASISTRAPRGSAATWTVARAGNGSRK